MPRPAPIDPSAVWFVIPAYNEGGAIGRVIASVRERYPNIVIVDDASTDNTAAVAGIGGARLVRHPINLGQGAALQTGIDYALAQGAEYIVTFDADGQHDVEDVAPMLAALQARGADLALGSRFLGRTVGMPRSRWLLLKAATLFTRLTVGLALTDCHNGLRVLGRHAAERIRIRQNRMAHASELLEAIRSRGLSYVEVPVTIAYTDYSRAKGQRLGDALVVFKDLLTARLAQ